jgi:hypothetical protein
MAKETAMPEEQRSLDSPDKIAEEGQRLYAETYKAKLEPARN